MAFNSMSSRSFREMVLSQSIASFFSGRKSSPRSPPPTEQTSDATTTSAQMTTESGSSNEFKDVSLEDQDESIHPMESDTGSRTQDGESFNGKIDPFAGGVEGGVMYKSMAWGQAGMVMVAENISLGILSLPKALSTLGLIPGLILLVSLGAMASYTGFIIGQMKIAYPHIHSMGDAGEVLFGRWGGEVLALGQLLFFIFIMGSHILAFSITMNVLTEHATCTIVFMALATMLSLILTLPRTLKKLSYWSVVSFISIIGAVLITIIGVSINRPAFHSDRAGNIVHDFNLWPEPTMSLQDAFLAIANIVFAYAGHVAFFSFISELKEAKDFPKALAFLQITDISMYIVTAVVVYFYAGSLIASPALNSSGPLFRKIAYGVALPTILIAGVVNGHIAVKYVYVRFLRNNKDDIMHQKSLKARGIWVLICAILWTIAWVIAEGIPVFNDLLGLTSALFASWFTFGLSGMFWLHLNLKKGEKWWPVPRKDWSWKNSVLLILNMVNILVGTAICVIGLYAAAKSIQMNSRTRINNSVAPIIRSPNTDGSRIDVKAWECRLTMYH